MEVRTVTFSIDSWLRAGSPPPPLGFVGSAGGARGRNGGGLSFLAVLYLRYEQLLAFSGRPTGRPVFTPLHKRVAQQLGGQARCLRLAAMHSWSLGPGQISTPLALSAAAGGPLPRAAHAPPLCFLGLCALVGPSNSLSCLPRRVVFSWAHWASCTTLLGPAAFSSWGTGGGRCVLPSPFVCLWRSTSAL